MPAATSPTTNGLGAKWLLLCGIAFAISIGFKTLFGIICCVIGLLGGLIIGIYWLGKQNVADLETRYRRIFASVPNFTGIHRIKTAVLDTRPLPSLDHRLTGNAVIDEALGEVLTYVMRDFVSSWYSQISGDQTFLNAIYCAMQRICRLVSARAREVDWTTYFTTRLVDDFASHIRLYRRACEKVAERRRTAPNRGDSPFRRGASFNNQHQPSSRTSSKLDASNGRADFEHFEETEEALALRLEIEAVFFELEKDMEAAAHARQMAKVNAARVSSAQTQSQPELNIGDVCISRERVASDPATLRGFAQALSEVLLYLVIAPADFNNRTLRCIVREVFANQVLVPTLNTISDPDYVNLSVARLCKPNSLTSEAFFSVLQSSESIDELVSVQQKLETEIAKQRSQDVGDIDDALVKATLQNLTYLNSLCTVRIQKLKNEQYKLSGTPGSAGNSPARTSSGASSGSKTRRLHVLRSYPSVVESDSHSGHSSSRSSAQNDAPLAADAVSFDTLMNKSAALAYFLEFLRTSGDEHYLLFYLTLDGFRISVEQRIQQLRIKQSMNPDEDLPELDFEAIRDESLIVFEQFIDTEQLEIEAMEKNGNGSDSRRRKRIETISDKRPFSRLDRSALLQMWNVLKSRQPNEDMFDDLLHKLSTLLQGPQLFGAFRKSELHARMLRELELDSDTEDDESSRVDSATMLTESTELEQTLVADPTPAPLLSNSLDAQSYQLVASVTQTDIVRCETPNASGNKPFALYSILVQLMAGSNVVLKKWVVQRRFSDFDHLHSLLEELAAATNGTDIARAFGVTLRKPEKRTFNMTKSVLDRRRIELQTYLSTLLPVVSRMIDINLSDEIGESIRDSLDYSFQNVAAGSQNGGKGDKQAVWLPHLYDLVVRLFLDARCTEWEKVQLPKTIRRPTALSKALNVFGLMSSSDSGNSDANSALRRTSEAQVQAQAKTPASPSVLREPFDELTSQLMAPLQKTTSLINSLADQTVNAVTAAANAASNAKEPPKFLNTLTNLVSTSSTSNTPHNQPAASGSANSQSVLDMGKVALGLDQDDDENIPLRILLLMMDEVFEMRKGNQWLRRRVVVILKQILKSILGDMMNRKIVEYVASLTSAESIAYYVRQLLASFWPSQMLVDQAPERDYYTKMRTRVICKTKLLGSLPEELRPLLSAEVTRQGIFRMVSMMQHENLNRRLALVVLEGMLQTMFPSNHLDTFFQRIYTVSVEQARAGAGRPAGASHG